MSSIVAHYFLIDSLSFPVSESSRAVGGFKVTDFMLVAKCPLLSMSVTWFVPRLNETGMNFA